MSGPQSLRLAEGTHGDGVDRGDGSESDGDAASSFAAPSWAPTDASGMPGDLDDVDEAGDIFLKPQWKDDWQCSDGVWGNHARGGEEGEAEEDERKSAHGGTYGLLSANWGGHWKDPELNYHMSRDLKTCPCQVICLQEAEEALFS